MSGGKIVELIALWCVALVGGGCTGGCDTASGNIRGGITVGGGNTVSGITGDGVTAGGITVRGVVAGVLCGLALGYLGEFSGTTPAWRQAGHT